MDMHEVYLLHKETFDSMGVQSDNIEKSLEEIIASGLMKVSSSGTLYFTMPGTGEVVGRIVPKSKE